MFKSFFEKLFPKKIVKRNTATVYVPVSSNLYFDGNSYRVRVTKNNVRTSKSFRDKEQAILFRDELKNNVIPG